MTIGQKIIFSSTFVALLAGLAVFMSWNSTQSIKKDLVEIQASTSQLAGQDNSDTKHVAAIESKSKMVASKIDNLNFWVMLVGGLTFLLAIIFGRVIAYNLSQSLNSLRAVADKLQEGDYSVRTDLKTKDEFGMIGSVLDEMADNLKQNKVIEDQKQEMGKIYEELKIKNDSLDKFVYRVSHDLKAPVVNIQSLLKLVKTKVNLDNKMAEQSFMFLEQSSQKLQQTITDLLEVSRIERSLKSAKEWIDLEKALYYTKEKCLQVNPVDDLQVTSDLKVREVFFAPMNFNSILSNLLSNSIKFRTVDLPIQIHVTTERQGDFVCLTVKDNGIGLDLEKYKDKLFEMFNRFHDHVDGSGVGLYIIKKIVEEAGGKIEVKSSVGNGAVFKIFIKHEEVAELV